MRLHKQVKTLTTYLEANAPREIVEAWWNIVRGCNFGPTVEDVNNILENYFDVPAESVSDEDKEYILDTADENTDNMQPDQFELRDAVEQCVGDQIEEYKKEHGDE